MTYAVILNPDALETKIAPRSSNNSRSSTLEGNGSISRNNKIHPKRPTSMNDFQFPIKPLSPINMQRIKLQRPLSTDLQRTISAVDVERLNHLTHRRTQSYAATTSHNRIQSRLNRKFSLVYLLNYTYTKGKQCLILTA